MSRKRPANTIRNRQRKRKIVKKAKRKDARIIFDLQRTALTASKSQVRFQAGAELTRRIGNIKAMPLIEKMLLNDPSIVNRMAAAEFFFHINDGRHGRSPKRIQKSIEILERAEHKETRELNKLSIKIWVKVLKDMLNPLKKISN